MTKPDFYCVRNYNCGFNYKGIHMLDQKVMEVMDMISTVRHLKNKGFSTRIELFYLHFLSYLICQAQTIELLYWT